MKKIRSRFLRILQYFVVSFFIIVPFIKTNSGESLIRFDVKILKLHFFGRLISFDNFFTLSIFIIWLVFLVILLTQIFGRVWCGWICPQSVCGNIIVKVSSHFKSKNMRKVIDIGMSVLAAFILAAVCIFYFIFHSAER